MGNAVPDLPMSLAKEFVEDERGCNSRDSLTSSQVSSVLRQEQKQEVEEDSAVVHDVGAGSIMSYLYNAQTRGLIGLWSKVCRGSLPSRCNKRWFFTSFCGVTGAEFDSKSLRDLDEGDDIEPWLQGTIKPYDVVSFMTLLDDARNVFDFDAAAVEVYGKEYDNDKEENGGEDECRRERARGGHGKWKGTQEDTPSLLPHERT